MFSTDRKPRPTPRRERKDGSWRDRADHPPSHFGPYKVAHSLASILDELGDRRLRARCGKLFGTFAFALNQIEHVPSPPFRRWLIRLVVESFRAQIRDYAQKDPPAHLKAWSHLESVLVTHARVRVRQVNTEIHEAWLEETRVKRGQLARKQQESPGREQD